MKSDQAKNWPLTMGKLAWMLTLISFASAQPHEKGPILVSTPPSIVRFSSTVGALLECIVEGSPPPSVSWVGLGGHPLHVHDPLLEILQNRSLHLRPFAPERYRPAIHSSVVHCSASNIQGTVLSPPINIQAVVWQHVDIDAKASSSHIGGFSLLKCVIPTHLSSHLTVISWETPFRTIYPSMESDGRLHMLPGQGDLLVSRVSAKDAELTFSCKLYDSLSGKTMKSSKTARINVIGVVEATRPKIRLETHTYQLTKKNILTIPCIADGYPLPVSRWRVLSTPQISFSFPASTNVQQGYNISPMKDGSSILILDGWTFSQKTTFVCVANNSMGVEQFKVEVSPLERLRATSNTKLITATLARTATMQCQISDPTATLSWYKDGSPLISSGRYMTSKNQLIVSSVNHQDSGMYQCMVKRGTDGAQASIQLVLAESRPSLMYQFIEQTIRVGTAVSLRCKAIGNPIPKFQWTLDGIPLRSSARMAIREQPGNHGEVSSEVTISSVMVEDGGTYACKAINKAGHVTHESKLNVYGPPKARRLEPISAVAGSSLKLYCPVTGYPLATYSWTKDDLRVGSDGLGRGVTGNGILILDKVKPRRDAGVYSCRAKSRDGVTVIGSVQVAVMIPPKITPFIVPNHVLEEERITLTCTISRGDTPISMYWLKDGNHLRAGGHLDSNTALARRQLVRHPRSTTDGIIVTHLSSFNSILTIERLQASHAGIYTCIATNAAKTAQHSVHLNVNVAPRWTTEPQNAHIHLGQALILGCAAHGNPKPIITWKVKFDKVIGGDGYRSINMVQPRLVQLSDGSLFSPLTTMSHKGSYMCTANNNVSHIHKVVQVTLKSAPYFTSYSESRDYRVGEVAILECTVDGDPRPSVSWSRYGRVLQSNHKYTETITMTQEGSTLSVLKLTRVISEDRGEYHCNARNSHGRNTRIIQLKIHESPGAPQGVRVVTVQSRSVDITWLASGSESSSFIVQYKLRNEPWEKAEQKLVSASDASSAVRIASLSPATEYVIRISASNQVGMSPASEEVHITTDSERPGAAPELLAVEALDARTLEVHWSPPPQDLIHGDMHGYHVGYRIANYDNSQLTKVSYNFTTVEVFNGPYSSPSDLGTLKTTLTGLNPYSLYKVVVRAFNSKGEGPLSASKSATTHEDVPEVAPTNVQCGSSSTNSLRVSWNKIPANLRNGIMRGYSVEYERLESYVNSLTSSQVIGDNTKINNLLPATNYSIRVRGQTSAGFGPWSSPITCSTEEDVPSKPHSILAVAESQSSFIVAWGVPLQKGGRIIAYTIRWQVLGNNYSKHRSTSRDSKGKNGIISVSGSTHYARVGGVRGSMVEIEVTAATRVGSGPSAFSRVTLTSTIAATIFSIGGPRHIKVGESILMPCGFVGMPDPKSLWRYMGQPIQEVVDQGFRSTLRYEKTGEGLLLKDVTAELAGNYSCEVYNEHGSDKVHYQLKILGPPNPPLVLGFSDSSSTATIQWNQGSNGGAPIKGYTFRYRKIGGKWIIISLDREEKSYTLKDLDCGSQYEIVMTSWTSIGESNPSESAFFRTRGQVPKVPDADEFLQINSSEVVIFTSAWRNPENCPVTSLKIEYRKARSGHWIQVSNENFRKRYFSLIGLETQTPYLLRVSAESSAGPVTHIYSFSTLTESGESVDRWLALFSTDWLSARVLLPLVSSGVALASSLALACYCIRKKNVSPPVRERKLSRASSYDDEKTEKEFYATIRKAPIRGDNQSDTVPEDADDICPYATFQLRDPPPQDIPMYSIYHEKSDQKLESGHKRSRSRGHKRIESNECVFSDAGSGEALNGAGLSASYSEETTNEPKFRKKGREEWYSGSSGGDTIYGGAPLRGNNQPLIQQRIHHNSSSSPESSPTKDRKSFPRRSKSKPGRNEFEETQPPISINPYPPKNPTNPSKSRVMKPRDTPIPTNPPPKPSRTGTGSSDNLLEMSEAECDRAVRVQRPTAKGLPGYGGSHVPLKPAAGKKCFKTPGKDYSIAF